MQKYPAGDGQFYGFGGCSRREGNSSGFFRTSGDGRTIPSIYPEGFLPTIITQPTDFSAALGYKGTSTKIGPMTSTTTTEKINSNSVKKTLQM